jgi:hypothetical protein
MYVCVCICARACVRACVRCTHHVNDVLEEVQWVRQDSGLKVFLDKLGIDQPPLDLSKVVNLRETISHHR